MPQKTRPETARDVTMLSGLSLFLGFIALLWSAVATFGKDYPQSVSAALLGIGLMLAGIGIRLKLLAPLPGPEPLAEPAGKDSGEWPAGPGEGYGDPDGK
ncbi:hypothetical protein [Phytomonospora endophytica]|uniref:Uncharacterized protein n=1 Tax=Phytomonospora endophytica TaxID=714109 RepID=A0A841G6X1_9ACTN|nr:hypothetical protein [Phytomonospora endophytica]MBB6039820.1 hypothetical protein [Phytomonospora endophytica]